MVFRFGKKDIDKKKSSEPAIPQNNRGHALTEDMEGFKDLRKPSPSYGVGVILSS